jgi:hypothetical protein
MGLSSSPLFANPSYIIFSPKKKYSESILQDIIIPNIPISTGGLIQKMMEYYEYGMKVYGYLTKENVTVWKYLLTEILEQNPKEKWVEFHFYCGEIGKAYYLKAIRKQDTIIFSIMVGSENDGAYHNVSFEDNDNNIYSIDELEDMNKEDSINRFLKNSQDDEDDEGVFVNYAFDVDKYKIVYNIKHISFTEERHQ